MSTPDTDLIHLREKDLASTILRTGLFAGTLDISAAVINYMIATKKNPVNVLRFISSGVFGKSAFEPENSMMPIWGLGFHYLIALGFTLIFFLAYPQLPFLRGRKYQVGIMYGIFVWLVMNMVVVPLSRTPVLPFKPLNSLIGILILIAAIGIPISLSANKFYGNEKAAS